MYKKIEKSDLAIVFPIEYARCNMGKDVLTNRKFYITYIMINLHRSKYNTSRITVADILNFYGIALNPNKKPEAFRDVVEVLKYMEQYEMIKTNTDLEKIKYTTIIEIDIVPENFDPDRKFVIFEFNQFDRIMGIPRESLTRRKISRESVLIVFLYMKSFMKRKRKNNLKDTEPSAFWGSIEQMSSDIGLSQPIITKCISVLTSDENQWKAPILFKYRTNMSNQDLVGMKIPNIYVEKKEGYYREVQLALDVIIKRLTEK